MNTELTELVFILDRSGSMGGLESDTIGGFNGMISKQKVQGKNVNVTTILFDDEVDIIHDRFPVGIIEPLTEKEYFVRDCTKDYIINYQDMQGIGMTGNLALPTLIAICSAALGKTPLNSLAILGEISIGGTLIKVDELASTLQVCLDSGAKKVLLPITSAGDLGTVPSDLVGAFSLIFYSSAEEAVFKALGVE